MKKIILLLLLVSGFVNAQENLKEYVASNGITYKVGDMVLLGRGSGGQGTFVYLKIAGWMAGSSTQIGSAYSGLNVEIKKIKKQKFKGAEKIVFTVGGGNITNYSLEIEEAIGSCEIKDCNTQSNAPVSQTDKYDQLKKLKALLADGTLTQEEYEAEKKKLLN
ncbi:MAG: SHOCT domain-containing protein [Flavobacterium sp.]|nr:SHOCT domain-containing protein [Flavobacterium sp.]